MCNHKPSGILVQKTSAFIIFFFQINYVFFELVPPRPTKILPRNYPKSELYKSISELVDMLSLNYVFFELDVFSFKGEGERE